MFIKAMLYADFKRSVGNNHPANRFSLHDLVRTRLAAYLRAFGACLAVARQRRQLRALDDAALCDIGITRGEALREADRSFWDIPEHGR